MPRKKAPKAPAAPLPAAQVVARPRDIRPFIYLGFNQVFAVGYLYMILSVIPNRLPSGAANLWALPVIMQVVAIGAAMVFVRPASAKKVGWWVVVIGSSLLVAVTLILIIRVLISAAFLSGVYGAFGKAAATTALIGVALVVEAVGLLPIFQIKYMRTRAGRRAYAMGP